MIFGCGFKFCDTYILGPQVRVTTRPKLVLVNFFNSCLGGLICVQDPNQVLKYVSRCTKFDIKTSNNKAYHYILECIAYLPVPGGIFPDFLRPFSFPSFTRAFHSIDEIIGGCSYLGFYSRWTLYWSHTIFRCFPAFCRTFDVSNVSFSNKPAKWLVKSSFKYFDYLFHIVQMVGPNISKDKSFICL